MSRSLVPQTHGYGRALPKSGLCTNSSSLVKAHVYRNYQHQLPSPLPCLLFAITPESLHIAVGVSPSEHTVCAIPALLCVGLSCLRSPLAPIKTVPSPAGCDKLPYLKNILVTVAVKHVFQFQERVYYCVHVFFSDQQKHLKKKMILTVLLMKYLRSLTLTKNLFKNSNPNLQVTHLSELPFKASVKVAAQCTSVEAPFHVGLEQTLHREHVTDFVV